MDTRNNDFDFDFTPIGQAIKKARTAKGMTREQLARIVDYDPRHLQAIENEGQKPSLELLIQLVTMFGVSVDEYIFPDNEVKRSSVRRRLSSYRPSSLSRTVAGVITPFRLILSTSCSISSSMKTLNGWSGNSSISEMGISLILLSFASSRLWSVSNRSS